MATCEICDKTEGRKGWIKLFWMCNTCHEKAVNPSVHFTTLEPVEPVEQVERRHMTEYLPVIASISFFVLLETILFGIFIVAK